MIVGVNLSEVAVFQKFKQAAFGVAAQPLQKEQCE